MASAEAMARPSDRHSRRRPFTNWMKRLANLKNSSSESGSNGANKHTAAPTASKSKNKRTITTNKNNPYSESAKPPPADGSESNCGNGPLSFYTPPSGRSISYESPSHSRQSLRTSSEGQPPRTSSTKCPARTQSTYPDTMHSETQSKADTSGTTGGGPSSNGIAGGEGSTFSSRAPSVRSLTTTLTTMQSAAPSALLPGHNAGTTNTTPLIATPHNHTTHFSHQFPSSPPASAIPSHVVAPQSGGHPATYNTATANNLLTDNASILTLASSSKRRRRNSLDTNASVRALAPSSVFGGSRESLPMSVLSGNVGDQANSVGMQYNRPSVPGLAGTERASVYSSYGNAPALSSERNSYYAAKERNTGDGASVRSGLVSHGRNDSTTGSIGVMASTASPLTNPRELPNQGRASRRNSGWGEFSEDGKGDLELKDMCKGKENIDAKI